MSEETEQPTQPTPTPAGEWRKPREEGYLLTLPSGKVARLRAPALHAMMAQGKIPQPLVNMAAEVVWEGDVHAISDALSNADESEASREKIRKMVPEFMPLAHIVCRAAFVEPRIADDGQEPGDGEISIEDLDPGDIFYVWKTTTRGASTLEFFRDLQKRDVEDVHDVHGEGDGPEPDDGD